MAKRCKHELAKITLRDGTTRPGFIRSDVLSAKCDDCGEQLSLGESNDEPVAVKIEMRAAELEPIWGLKLMSTLIERSQGEIDGGDCHSMHALGETRGGDYPATLDAGWLAREMATHDDREARDRDASAWPWDPTRPLADQYPSVIRERLKSAADDFLREQTRRDVAALDAPHAEFEVIAGFEFEIGVEVLFEMDYICLDWLFDCAACDVADDLEIGGEA